MEIAFLGAGGTEVELFYDSSQEPMGNPESISLGFKVNSVNEQIKLIEEKGLSVESGPFQPNPNVKFFFVRDPNGVKIQFVEDL